MSDIEKAIDLETSSHSSNDSYRSSQDSVGSLIDFIDDDSNCSGDTTETDEGASMSSDYYSDSTSESSAMTDDSLPPLITDHDHDYDDESDESDPDFVPRKKKKKSTSRTTKQKHRPTTRSSSRR